MSTSPGQKTVFLDRDGTLIEEVNFLHRVEDLRFFEYTDEAVRILKDAGFLVIVVTNQSGIGREIYTEGQMSGIHEAIQQGLTYPLDAFYFCPHLPDAGCECRKPGLGMIRQAARDFQIDLGRSWMIGDKRLDIELGLHAGFRTVMVRTGYGRAHEESLERMPELIAEDLLAAVMHIVGSDRD